MYQYSNVLMIVHLLQDFVRLQGVLSYVVVYVGSDLTKYHTRYYTLTQSQGTEMCKSVHPSNWADPLGCGSKNKEWKSKAGFESAMPQTAQCDCKCSVTFFHGRMQ